jgi:hypothetical protein
MTEEEFVALVEEVAAAKDAQLLLSRERRDVFDRFEAAQQRYEAADEALLAAVYNEVLSRQKVDG